MIDSRLPIYHPATDSPHDLCVKDSLIEECRNRYIARRRDATTAAHPILIGHAISMERRADARIERLWSELS